MRFSNDSNRRGSLARGSLARLVAFASIVLALGVGCAAEGVESDTQPPNVSMAELARDGELSPLYGQRFAGSLNAHVPLRGLSPTANDEITAYAFDYLTETWVEVGKVAADPIAIAVVEGVPMHPFDLGVACGYGCEATIPPYAWAGFGPFRARIKFHSAAHGWLLAPPAIDPEHPGERPADAAEVVVFAEPLPRP